MRKAINIAALVVFIWLVIDAFQIHNTLLSILLVGVVPGTDIILHPYAHLALLIIITIIVSLEVFTKNLKISKHIRNLFANPTTHA